MDADGNIIPIVEGDQGEGFRDLLEDQEEIEKLMAEEHRLKSMQKDKNFGRQDESMQVKKVNQYICDYCGKRQYAAGAMRKHEKHCTMNPDRECRMCVLVSGAYADLSKMMELLPEMKTQDDNYGGVIVLNEDEIQEAMKKVREECENCPACILAAIRQKGIFVNVTGFDYKKEVASFWGDYNDSQKPECYY